MLLRNLSASSALSLDEYADIDRFRDSERYVRAESIPLSADRFSAARASLELPPYTLSLVRTFPRIINGYDTGSRLLIVVPMDDISSARINGEPIGQCLLLLKGSMNCTVLEPEARQVAILSARPETLNCGWIAFENGYLLFRPSPNQLVNLQTAIRSMLELASDGAGTISAPVMQGATQASVLKALNAAINRNNVHNAADRKSLDRYKSIVDRIDDLLRSNPTKRPNCDRLAEQAGASARTLQTAVRSICGLSTQSYVRLRRLWLVRRQLRTGASALTVRAAALAHGFVHMGEFSETYRKTFGELPSETLANIRRSLA